MKRVLLFFFLLCLVFLSSAQDLIYRSGSNLPVLAKNIINEGSGRSYQLFDVSDSAIYHISISKLDSIIYSKGTKETFMERRRTEISSENPLSAKDEVYRHHLAGLDAAALFYKNFRFTYEYFPFNPHLGLKASLSLRSSPYKIEIWEGENIDNDETYYYRNFRGYSIWHGTLGCNYYFFPPGSFRAITGLHYLTGSYYVSKIITDNNNNVVGTEDIKRPINGLLLSSYLFWTLNDYLDFDVGFDIPLIMRPPMRRAVLTAEFLLNF
jgi:hypothetical protein